MDVYKALRELHKEKERLDAVIASLEAKMRTSVTGHRRGRRSMGAEERKAVSARMAAYWASRRAAQNGSEPQDQTRQQQTAS